MHTQRRPYSDASIAAATALIRAGQPVAVPTETVYGLAANATSDDAVAAIYAAKGRPQFNPLIVHVRDSEAAFAIGDFDPAARALADRYWPGPLTLVVPLKPDAGIARLATAGLATIGLRVPAHRAMQALLRSTGKPLAAPSANVSGSISPTNADHVMRSLGGRIGMVIDDGRTPGGIESTIIGMTSGEARLLRPGPIVLEGLSCGSTDAVEAPGQLAAHYAPSKPLRMHATTAETNEWHIGFGKIAGDTTLSATGNTVEAAARLFALLHEADRNARAAIAIAPVPEEGLGIAINDRLRRAVAGSGQRSGL
jgi:L-threonylcarbamoyladenylate synthase